MSSFIIIKGVGVQMMSSVDLQFSSAESFNTTVTSTIQQGATQLPMLPQFGNLPKLSASDDIELKSVLQKGDNFKV